MKQYGVYRCDTCHREIEHEQDQLRPFLNKCNITYKCEGKLSLVDEKNIRSQFKTVTKANVVDWVPRGTVTELKKQLNDTIDAPDISLLTDKDILTLAIDSSLPIPANLTVTFKVIADVSKQFVDFAYTLSGTQSMIVNDVLSTVVQGADSSPLRKILRFSPTDTVKVLVDGAEPIGQYTLGVNSIIFAPQLSKSTQTIKIVVYNQPPDTKTSINYTYGNSVGAWGNIKEVTLGQKSYNVLNSSEINLLPANKHLVLDTIEVPNTGIDLKEYVIILLSSDPWTHVDRTQQNVVLPKSLGELSVTVDSMGHNIKILKSVGIVSLFPFITIKDNLQSRWENDKIPTITGPVASSAQIRPIHSFILGVS